MTAIRRKCLFLLMMVLSVTLLKAQITVTSPLPSGFTYYSASADGVIVFGVKNTNTTPIIIQEVGNYVQENFTGTFTLWYHPTAITGAPTAISTANGWVSVATSTVSSSATGGIRPIFTGLNLTLPANATVRVAISGPPNSPFYGGAGTVPDVYSSGGLEIYGQANAKSPGYAGAFPGPPTNTPRSFIGSITFMPTGACTTPPVAGSAIASASKVCAGNSFSLDLAGASIGTGQVYQWQRSDDNSAWTNWGSGSTSPNYTTTQNKTSYYRASVTCGGNTVYSTSVKVDNSTAVSGTFTINSAFATAGNNFQSFTEAVASLTSCGINGPVVFNVEVGSGPYNEQITIPQIPGASATNTITFNGNGASIEATPVSATRAIIRLDGADYVTFNNLRVASLSDTYGWGFHLTNGADRNTINNCTIDLTSVTSTTSSNSAGIVASGSATSVSTAGDANNNTFSNNTIIGGYEGVIITGATGSLSAVNNRITNNTIKDFYTAGVELYNNDGATISFNDISRAARVAVTTFYGVEFNAGNKNCIVNGNRIHDTHNTATTQTGTAYGIYLTGCDAPAGSENKITNNLIYKFNSGSGDAYGFYNSGSDGAYYFHNTVVLDNAASTAGIARGLYQTTDATNIQFKNNIIYITRGGTGAKNCLYFATSTSTIVSNNNLLYLNAAAGTNGIGYYSGNIPTLAGWKTANGGVYDQQSISIDPLFANMAANNFSPTEGYIDNKGVPVGVTADVLQAARNATTPDMGAYEFSPAVCTGAPAAGTAVSTVSSVCVPGTPFIVSVTGASKDAGITYQWQRSFDNVTWTDIVGATDPSYQATGLGRTTYFRRVMTCSGASSNSTAALVSLNPAITYAKLPYTESFENAWINGCGTNDIPNDYWRNNPITGNNSWRKNDDVTSAAWTSANGAYTPTASDGSSSARFHSYNASSGTKGQFDLYVNANTAVANKKLTFDYINTSGNDSLVFYLSTDGGVSFQRLDSVKTSAVWKSKTILLNSSSATTVIRFEATSDFGTTDIGVDNIRVADLLDCTGTPAGGTLVSSVASLCNPATPVALSVTGVPEADGLTYQWQSSTDNVIWTDISGAKGITYTVSGLSSNTYFRRQINCTNTGLSNTSTSVLITVTLPNYAPLPLVESFETSWIDICDTKDAPNNFWRNGAVTGNTSWRKNDEGTTAAWTSTSGAYTPTASDGTSSARFHSYNASSGTKGQLDVYVNANTAAAKKRLKFDYINTSGTDSLVVYLSTNGGTSFSRLDSVKTSTVWNSKTIFLNSTSATTIIRFEAISDFGTTDIGLDNIKIVDYPTCSGTPAGGTATSTRTDVCNATTPFTISVSGSSEDIDGLIYQWQSSTDNVNWTDITGAKGLTYTSTGIAASTYFRRQTICAGASLSSPSTAIQVRFASPDYAPMPYTESFETSWVDICDVKDVPNNFWRNGVVTGNTSWRKNDEGTTAAWTSTSGAYTPTASDGTSSARFHSYNASSGTKGQLNLYVNANTAEANKKLSFDYINTSGNDSLVIYLSTNGGTSFQRLDSVRLTTIWKNKAILFNTLSATTIIRFEATSDFGTTDIGLDNIKIVDFPDCNGTPAGGAAATTRTEVCNATTPFTLSVSGATEANKLTYQWQSSTDNVTWTDITDATAVTYTSTGIAASTYFRRQTICTSGSGPSAAIQVRFAAPDYAPMPYTESFETSWVDICDVKDVPNNFWRNGVVTGNTSWRKNDEGTTAAWTSTSGAYTPTASDGTSSARFHSYNSTKGTKGQLDVFINAKTASPYKKLMFDYINTSGTDSLVVYLSADGGKSFSRLDSANTSSVWITQEILFNTLSDSTVIRFEATSDFGTTDIGLDNIQIVDFPDCDGTPAGGVVTSSATNVCQEAFTLKSTGVTTGAGISYQWQSSTDNATWTNIVDATEGSLTTAQVGTHYYRLAANCAFSGLNGYSNAVQVISPSLVSGSFTIDNSQPTGGTNFTSFNDAYQSLKCGINGPVVFDVKTGTGLYDEQLIMSAVPGTSGINTITFQGNGVAAIGFGSANTNERAVIKLKGASHFIFDSLIINANSGTYGYGIQLISNADSNIVKNCVINSSLTSTATNYAGIVINGTDAGPAVTGTVLCDYNTFSNNTINGGYYGITLYATFAGGANGYNQFINNDIKDFYLYGMYVGGSYNTLIEGNTFRRPTRTTIGDFNGIYFTTQKNTSCIVTKNKIRNPFGGAPTSTNAFYGINFSSSDGSIAAENYVTNNIIYNINGEGAATAISNTGSDYVYYMHNTISLDNKASTSAQTTRGFYQTTAATGLYLYNNIISITRGGAGQKHGIYLSTGLINDIDYNVYYINSAGGSNFLGYYTANRADLNAWRTATGLDLSSLSASPSFADATAGNLVPGNSGIDNKGIYLGIDVDINDAARSNTTPDIGAYEFTPPPCAVPPVPGTTALGATTVCQNSPVRLNLTIGTYGSGQTFQWESATSAAGPFAAVGTPLLTPDTTIMASATLYYRAAITCGSFTVYSDTALLSVNPGLPTGTYTINKNVPTNYVPGVAGGNFASFAAVKSALGCGIVGGPVVFDVVAGSGTYNEQFRLDSIPGVSAVNTITFNGNGNTIAFPATVTTERAVIKLSGTDHIIFDSLTIDAKGGTYGFGVQLINNADSNIFRHCTIIADTSSTTTDFAGVVINAADGGATTTGNTLCDANIFDGNTIIGGYYGMTLMGSATALLNDNQIINNKIEEFNSYGIYVAGTYNTLIEGNTITRPARVTSASSVYGVYMASAVSNKLVVSKNRFTQFFGGNPASTSSFYGVYHNSVDATTGNQNLIVNNLFYNIGGQGAIYTIYNNGSNNVYYYHNTLAIDNAASTTTAPSVGFYLANAAVSGVEFRDNMVTITRGGAGTKHALYMEVTADVTSDNNNLYVQGSNSYVGYNGANRVTLANWQTAASKDQNSLSMDPIYTNPATGDYTVNFLPLDNKGADLDIADDILSHSRSATTPDIGAFEFTPATCTTPPVAGAAVVTPNAGICLETPVELTLTGNSPIGTLTFQWQTSADGITWTNLSGIQYTPAFKTITTTSTYYRAAVTCSGTTTYSTPVQVMLNSILPGGTYTIDNTTPTTYVTGVAGGNFNSFQSAVNAMTCGVGGQVVFDVAPGTYTEQISIPYVPGTSNSNTVTFQGTSSTVGNTKLTFGANSTDNYTLRLDSTRNFIFRHLTIEATDATYGRAILLTRAASSDSILNCKIVAPVTTASTTDAVGIYADAFEGRNITIKGNDINNGATGIYFAGTSATALAARGHVIDGNTVTNAYSHSINVRFTTGIQISNNTVNMNAATANNTAGIFATYADSAFRLTGNVVNINNNINSAYGVYVLTSRSLMTDSSIVASNKVLADNNNTGTIYALAVSGSKGISVVNNTVGINSAGATSYGLYSFNNTENINYYNNTTNVTAASAGVYAAYFTNTAVSNIKVFNNVFSNSGGGRALYVNNPSYFTADYNMLYSSGANLVQVATGSTSNFAAIDAWKKTWNWDQSSISYAPAFVSNTDLRPDLNNPDVWAMHGRGLQIKGNTYDFDNNSRPDALTTGVPDLGAYEFYPNVLPTVLTATPSSPVVNGTQTFTYGSDTVMKITWGATVPPSVEVRRFSGVVPSGLVPGTDSMFFYTKVDIPGGANYNYATKLYYIDSWQGSIPQQYQIGMGRTTPSNAWVVGQNSRLDLAKKEISQEAITYLDRFTGLVNVYAQVAMDDSSSNRGKDFWVGYQRTNGFTGSNGGAQDMVVYMGAGAQDAHVTITIEGTGGTPWVRNYTVPANSALQSDLIPKTGTDDARLVEEGQYNKRGIHITSDVPIVAYAHIYESANSGATMLMPSNVWGYEYYTLSSRQNYTSDSYSAFHIVAQHDNTWVEINPSKLTRGGWTPNGGPNSGKYLVKLNKGDVYQVLGANLSGSEGYDLTGSYVKAIGNDQGQCYPIAVFAGSTRTAIGCGGGAGGSGDLIIQQILPYQAWGNKYVTAPTSTEAGPNASSAMYNVYRIMVKDPNTEVRVNGGLLDKATALINGRYYQIENNTANYIESNKPVLVAQFMSSSGSCTNTSGDGDPEMFYLSPLQQAIKSTQFYRNNKTSIDENFITLVIPTEGLTTLRIDGVHYSAYPVADRYVYAHPYLPGYSVVTKKWAAGNGSSNVSSEYPFTGIVYGLGSVESYGYNIGTLVKNLNNLGNVSTVYNTGATPTGYTCAGAPFKIQALLPVTPTAIEWKISSVPQLSPGTDVLQNNPVAEDTVTVDGIDYYVFSINQQLTITGAGTYTIPIKFWSPEIESCDKSKEGKVKVQVLPAPVTDFQIKFGNGGVQACEGETATLTGDVITSNGIALSQWNWTFNDGSKASGQIQTFSRPTAGTYPTRLTGITADGCVSDTIKQIVFIGKLTKAVVKVDSTGLHTLRFKWDPVPGASSYEVSTNDGATYEVPSSGATGLTHTINGLMAATEVKLIVRAIAPTVCQSSVSDPVTGMTKPDNVFIPNTFTPNGDGKNDVLLVYGAGIDQMRFLIFNQWGEKLFESSNPAIGWDGTYKGKRQPSGVYIYVVRLVMKDGSVVERKGSINLVR